MISKIGVRLVCVIFMAVLPFFANAQVTHFQYDSGYTFRDVAMTTTPGTDNCNSTLCTFHLMQTWGNGSPIKQYTYRGMDGSGFVVEFMNWRMLFPAGYTKSNTEKIPMIVMLHGAGQSGRMWTNNFSYAPDNVKYDNNDASIVYGGKEHETATGWNYKTGQPQGTAVFPGIVIWPQVSYNGAWENGWENGALADNNRMTVQIIEWVIDHYNIDPDRITIHGLSHGAQGALDLASKRADLFAAVLPMSGIATNFAVQTDILVTTPMWMFQGGKDTNPSPQASMDMKAMLVSKGGNPRYTLYPTVAHETWLSAFIEPDFFPFIVKADKKNIYKFCTDSACTSLPMKLGVSAGYASYQWTKNGNDIAGATTRFFTATENGLYSVRMKRQATVAGGTTTTANPVQVGSVNIVTAVQEPNFPISVFPNPFRDRITVTIPEQGEGKAVLTDLLGQPVETVSYTPTLSGEVALNFAEAHSGTYVLRVGKHSFKVVKE